ncbi:sulfatase [Polyangium aurulentum]|uniref:sulfatase n=1 Tax=Polyangium aurulentum TaxID=2567896 RepID=UPI0010AEA543|nr:sulfatase [Polyangium aurulentum]UQA60251.1 sulfatase [Polyangium aurulentum]
MATDQAPTTSHEAPEVRTVGGARAAILAAAALALVDAAAAHTIAPAPALSTRLVRHLYDAGPMFAAALVVAACARLLERTAAQGRFRRTLPFVLLALASLGAAYLTLPDDLSNFAWRVSTSAMQADALLNGLVVLTALGVPIAALVGRLLGARGWSRWMAVLAALGAAVVNHLVLRGDYPAVHLFLGLGAAALAGGALARAPLPRALRPLRPRAATALLCALSLLCAASLVVPPPDDVALVIARAPGSSLAWFVAGRILPENEASLEVDIPPAQAAWFNGRADLPDVPPTAPGLVPPDPIVIFLVIDSVRADVLADERLAPRFPNLTRLAAESRVFSAARSPGAQTVYTVSEVFAGKYYSQQYWSEHPAGGLWPHEDTSVRFPELLARAKIPTITFASKVWLVNEYGVVRGFTEETVVLPETTRIRAPDAVSLVAPAIARLSRSNAGPLFLYLHFLDAHFPYDRGGAIADPYEAYLREISVVDREIGRLRGAVTALGLDGRAVLVVTSDHGEAFGEHGTIHHSKTLYEELLRVPLFIRLPDGAHRRIDEPVSLMDLGPTVLDLFGRPTPAAYMGQSLVPLLGGEPRALSRPIAAEGRLKQAIVFPDGVKVIRDQRKRTLEIYDLGRDPGEIDNLALRSGEEASRVRLLRRFFGAHALRRPGYEPPYRR